MSEKLSARPAAWLLLHQEQEAGWVAVVKFGRKACCVAVLKFGGKACCVAARALATEKWMCCCVPSLAGRLAVLLV